MKKISVFCFLTILFAISTSSTVEPEIKTKVQLGEKLFFDPVLSRNNKISCADCHKPELAFADSVAVSPGVDGKTGKRNAPSVMNMASRNIFFYDGRANTLSDQVHFPIEDPLEMDFTMKEAVTRLNKNSSYKSYFTTIYNELPNEYNIADAIATYEETLETANTEFDAWMNDRPNKMSPAAIRGRNIFLSEKAKCFDCHFSPDFTVDQFKNIGLYDGNKYKDEGRYLVTKNEADLGRFKVPGLRNVAVTAPYMHDGSFTTLDQVIEYYSNPYKFVSRPINMDDSLRIPINFTKEEKSDLKAFLLSLTDRRFYKYK